MEVFNKEILSLFEYPNFPITNKLKDAFNHSIKENDTLHILKKQKSMAN